MSAIDLFDHTRGSSNTEEEGATNNESMQLPIPVDSITEKHLFDSRMVTLYGEVTGEKCNRLCSRLVALQEFDAEAPITLLIDSPGGDLMAGMMVYDLMNLIQPKVRTVAMGLAASMGQFLLSAGEIGERWIFPTARIMMHQPSSGIGGSAEDIRIQVEQHRLTRKIFEELQAANIGKSIEEIHNDSERDRWFTAQQAVDYGIADQILTNWRDLATT